MGKRKTRKRSRSRKKRGGTFGIDSLCIWYGKGNKGFKGYAFGVGAKPARKIGEIKEDVACTSIDVDAPEDATVLSIDNKKNVRKYHKPIENLPNQLQGVDLETFDEIEGNIQETEYDIYVVRYEEICGSLGERYELYKIKNAKIEENPDGYVVSTNYWKDDMYFTENEDTNKLDMKWGSTKRKGVPKTSLLLASSSSSTAVRRGSHGGKRRRRTKKRRRKSKRRRTKKRRRRRR
jgi:hypothetical protein